jgi:hypothetical protein
MHCKWYWKTKGIKAIYNRSSLFCKKEREKEIRYDIHVECNFD